MRVNRGKAKNQIPSLGERRIKKLVFRKVTLKERISLFWGKLRRFYYHQSKTSYIRESLARRVGECLRCGACCQLGHPCPFLAFNDDGLTYCKINNRKPKNCQLFPLDEKDLHDRDLVLPDISCGYSFKPKEPKD